MLFFLWPGVGEVDVYLFEGVVGTVPFDEDFGIIVDDSNVCEVMSAATVGGVFVELACVFDTDVVDVWRLRCLLYEECAFA